MVLAALTRHSAVTRQSTVPKSFQHCNIIHNIFLIAPVNKIPFYLDSIFYFLISSYFTKFIGEPLINPLMFSRVVRKIRSRASWELKALWGVIKTLGIFIKMWF